ncbi:ThuA domain-containing protein [Nonlabens xiamenensis]|uniref:ThuA domain-containing protein n=1 Tax=Nonlabens xiamenensis TaxID=2341043 RepID=UPI0013DE5464|nr:ThuA domain-containing protein [Nonlabens xiamenensis]
MAQPYEVLVFHKTNQYRHSSINAGITMITDLGKQNNQWNTTASMDASVFSAADFVDAQGNYKYDVIIFCSTTGNNLLNDAQRNAFEEYIRAGNGFVGIHAATDTYRDRSWPFYNELVGGIVQASPHHTPNHTSATIVVQSPEHPIVNHLGNTWNKSEEYYYWEINGGQLSADNKVLLEVQSTGDNSYDDPRPITWLKESITVNGNVTSGFRSFYTALGHNGSDYTNNKAFKSMIEKAILWAAGNTSLSVEDFQGYPMRQNNNPVDQSAVFDVGEDVAPSQFRFFDLSGRKVPVVLKKIKNGYEADLRELSSGTYLYEIYLNGKFYRGNLIKR